jgi:hypothetical protein
MEPLQFFIADLAGKLVPNVEAIRSATARPTIRSLNWSCQLARYPHPPDANGRCDVADDHLSGLPRIILCHQQEIRDGSGSAAGIGDTWGKAPRPRRTQTFSLPL